MKKLLFTIMIFMLVSSPVLAKGHIQDGLCKVFSGGDNPYLQVLVMHENSERNGAAIQFFEDGEIEKVAWYQKGALHGTFRSFWPNGQQKSIVDYDEGVLDGRAYAYDPSGRPQFEFYFSHGSLNGFGYYYQDGVLQKKVQYRDGRAFKIED